MAKGSGRTKNLRFGGGDLSDLFEYDIKDVVDDADLEPVFEIDVDSMDNDANTLASSVLSNIARIYSTDEFLKEHPDFKKRLDSEIQSLKMNYKMRLIDERVQDELVRAIGRKGDNASLYAVLPKLQAQMIATQNKIDSTLDRIKNLLKNYQMELNFEEVEESSNDESDDEMGTSATTRGTRAFIEKYKHLSYEQFNNQSQTPEEETSSDTTHQAEMH